MEFYCKNSVNREGVSGNQDTSRALFVERQSITKNETACKPLRLAGGGVLSDCALTCKVLRCGNEKHIPGPSAHVRVLRIIRGPAALFRLAITGGKSTYLTQKTKRIADTALYHFITSGWVERENFLSFQLEGTVPIR